MKEPKLLREYNDTYKDIPVDDEGRLNYLLSTGRFNNWEEESKSMIDKITSIKKKERSFVFYIIPRGTPRPRSSTRNGKTIFYVKRASDHKKFLEYMLSEQDNDLIFTQVEFLCKVYLPIPKSMRSIEKVCAELGYIRPISKPDWDNLAKTYCDMITGLLIDDDSQIVSGTLEKYYSVKPRIEITLKYMEDYDSTFNLRKSIERRERRNG